jgi:hypothetical protein
MASIAYQVTESGSFLQNLRPRLANLPMSTVLPLLSAAAPAELATDLDGSSQEMAGSQKPDEQTLALLKDLQLQGASGLALELISPQLDGSRTQLLA